MRSSKTPAPGPASGLLAAALLASVLAPAAAQVPGDSLRPVPVDSVFVEVLRTPVRLGTLPYPVSLLDRGDLREAKTGAFLKEALQGLPGVRIQNRFNYAVGERVSIRGFGARAQFGVRGAEVVVDGIPATLPDGQSTLDHVDLGSLGRVEALRGPASALWGNAAGGVLRVTTRDPPPVPIRQEAEALVGSHGLRRFQSVTAGRLDGKAYLLSLARLSWDGFRTLSSGSGTYGKARRHHLNAHVSLPLASGELRTTLNVVDLDAENPGSLSDSLLALDHRQAYGGNVAQGTGKQMTQGQLGARWTGAVRGVTGEVAAWGILRDLANPIPPAIVEVDRRAGGLRAQASGSGPEAMGSWVLGLEVERQADDRLNFDNDGGSRGALTLQQDETVRGLGLFGHVSVDAGRRLRALAGLRYDRVRFEVEDHFVGSGNPDDSGRRSMDAWSPSLGLHLELTPRAAVFGNVATVFETPTTTELANRPTGAGGFNPDLEPQRGVTFEAGVRGALTGELSYEATVFRTELDDELVSFQVPAAPGRSFFRNAGRSRRNGAEVVLSGPLGEHLGARLVYSWIDAVFQEFRSDDEDNSGNRVPGLAPHRGEALLTATGDRWTAEVRGEYVDAVPVDDANTERASSYGLVDVRAELDVPTPGSVEGGIYGGVTNLLDEEYVAAVTVNAFQGRFFEPGPGRSFYLGVRAVF